ncbi:hypothetical protein [Microbulbifer elongatus]|uniref:hypothetical protein n=1 Tax=Microbulbifer elongatus TaxID=86173 RepID=UPI001CFF0CA1|nr:hypothetical protein [Microbulbifer elongatus]
MKLPSPKHVLFLSVFAISACGGGGSGSDDNTSAPPPTGGNPPGSIFEVTPTADITPKNVSTFVGIGYEFIALNNDLINSFTNPMGVPAFSSSHNGTNESGCPAGGLVTNTISEDGALQQITFDGCYVNAGTTMHGFMEIATSKPNNQSAYDIELSFTDLGITDAEGTSFIRGTTMVEVPGTDEDSRRVNVISNIQVEDGESGELYSSESFTYQLPMSFPYSLTDALNISGGVGNLADGVAAFKKQSSNIGDRFAEGSNITGTGQSFGVMQLVGESSDKDLEILYFSTSGQSFSDLGVRLRMADIANGEVDFFSAENSAPQKNDRAFFTNNNRVDLGAKVNFSTYDKYLTDYDGDVLRIAPEMYEFKSESDIDASNISDFARVERGGYGILELTFKQPGDYQVYVRATDPDGDSFSLSLGGVYVIDSRDTDNDGIINEEDSDDDNDGVVDEGDLFPQDPTESTDFDGDGIGDVADTDDDNDSVDDGQDSFPENRNCALASEGTGNRCYIELIASMANFVDQQGVAYFWNTCYWDSCSPVVGQLIRWDMNTETFLAPLTLSKTLSDSQDPFRLVYSDTLNRAVIIFPDNEVQYFDLSEVDPQPKQASLTAPLYDWLTGLEFEGEYLVRSSYTGADAIHYVEVFDSAFNPVESATQELEASYQYQSNSASRYVEKGYTLDRATLLLEKFDNATYLSGSSPLVLSPDGTLALDSRTGEIFDIASQQLVSTIDGLVSSAGRIKVVWTQDGIINAGSEYNSTTRRYTAQFRQFNNDFELARSEDFPDSVFVFTDRGEILWNGNDYFLYTVKPEERDGNGVQRRFFTKVTVE